MALSSGPRPAIQHLRLLAVSWAVRRPGGAISIVGEAKASWLAAYWATTTGSTCTVAAAGWPW
jgi:hypothetical protein